MNLGAAHHNDEPAHEEVWLLLPWVANGSLPEEMREGALAHVKGCPACTAELAQQRQLCEALTAPERISYAPGPSLAKLLRRIDEMQAPAQVPPVRRRRVWGSPGLAWAATVLLSMGVGAGLWVQHGMAPVYQVHSDPAVAGNSQGRVLHIAFTRDLTRGEVEQLLRSVDAQVIEGPGRTGIFGVRPVQGDGQHLQQLAARLRTDPRVRWVEPLPADTGRP